MSSICRPAVKHDSGVSHQPEEGFFMFSTHAPSMSCPLPLKPRRPSPPQRVIKTMQNVTGEGAEGAPAEIAAVFQFRGCVCCTARKNLNNSLHRVFTLQISNAFESASRDGQSYLFPEQLNNALGMHT